MRKCRKKRLLPSNNTLDTIDDVNREFCRMTLLEAKGVPSEVMGPLRHFAPFKISEISQITSDKEGMGLDALDWALPALFVAGMCNYESVFHTFFFFFLHNNHL